MKLYDDYEEINKRDKTTKAAILIIGAFVSVILFAVIANYDRLSNRTQTQVSSVSVSVIPESPVDESASSYISSGLHVSDLNFYEDFKSEISDSTVSAEEEEIPEEEPDESTDGRHTLITNDDYTTEWVPISQYISKNEYDFTNLYNQSGKMKYFENGKCTSYLGVDISKNLAYVDFNKLKKDGFSFVLIRLGSRGYQSGQLVLDEYFKDNIKRASDAGLNIGIIFVSQAVTKEEAIEEVNFIKENIGDYSITYPVAFSMDAPKSEKARADKLSKNDRTTVAMAFLDAVSENKMVACVYGTKKWLLKDIDLAKVSEKYDVIYSEQNVDLPDFPYEFGMWNYSSKGTADGISGAASLLISFEDYSLK